MAEHRVPAFAWEYVRAGAEDERTFRDNRAGFAEIGWRPRTLVDTSKVDLETTILGRRSTMPLAIGPTGYNSLLWKDADIALARAARAAGIPYVLGTVSCNSLEELAAAVPDGNNWFQLYPLVDDGLSRDLLRRAKEAHVETLVVTTDTATLGRREWDARSYVRGRHLTLRHALDAACHPRWFFQALWPHGVPTLGNLLPYLPRDKRTAFGALEFTTQQFARDLDWSRVEKIRAWWDGALVIKGILAAADARRAREIGANGVIVSNHGGRQLDGAPATIRALPAIVDAVRGDIAVFLDSGIRRGGDIAKVIALGGQAALVGRATLFGVALGGEEGARLSLSLLREQLENTMALLGVPRLSELSADFLATR